MNHTMKLKLAPFEAIKSGVKDIELRLDDEKRQQLRLGDTITFTKLPDKAEIMTAKIIGLLHYPSFADLVEDFAPERMGGTDKVSIVEGMICYYSREEQSRCGVVGIKLRLVEN
jgi:ASC-1-like (ASCH) protein